MKPILTRLFFLPLFQIKLRNLEHVTNAPLIQLAHLCPLLLEVDLVSCTQTTDDALHALWRHTHHLRELSLAHCIDVTDNGFPSRDNADNIVIPGPEPYIGPRQFDHLRYLDLTSLTGVTDEAIDGIVSTMPRIRNLILAKCVNLTDESVYSICRLGKHIHYLHLGHVGHVTDRAVTALARACTRLRYIDLACKFSVSCSAAFTVFLTFFRTGCPQLTDLSVAELSTNLPKLKRIGLVRVRIAHPSAYA
jgi:F-box and leucine-rich repeat protein GRR1